jgi:hypothetical protein
MFIIVQLCTMPVFRDCPFLSALSVFSNVYLYFLFKIAHIISILRFGIIYVVFSVHTRPGVKSCYPDWECNLYFDEYGRNFHFVFGIRNKLVSDHYIAFMLYFYGMLYLKRCHSFPQEKIIHFHKCNNYRYLFR